MMNYRPGDTVYIIANNRFIRQMEILNMANGFVTLRFLDLSGYIRLRESRLFLTREAAEAGLPKKKLPYS